MKIPRLFVGLLQCAALVLLTGSLISVNAQKRNIMTIGDSNGAAKDGWVSQLEKLCPKSAFHNFSIPGNTIGFDNLNQERLNTLKNIDRYFMKVAEKTDRLDAVIVLLGTNDCKSTFQDRMEETVQNLESLMSRIRKQADEETTIILVTPPPYGPDQMLEEKYKGGNYCVQQMLPEYQRIADEFTLTYVNIYDVLQPVFIQYTTDGVHLTSEGQQIIAREILKQL